MSVSSATISALAAQKQQHRNSGKKRGSPMNISHQQSPNVTFEDLGPVKLKRRHILPPLPHFRNPLTGIPIAQRLVFGFLIPALIAAFAAGIIGIQSAQLLNQESDFYQNLFQSYS